MSKDFYQAYRAVISYPPALPENPECTVSENLGYGLSWFVTDFCSTTTVYPQARCSFYREENVSLNQ